MSGKRATEKARRDTFLDGLREALGRGGRTLAAMRRAPNAHGGSVLDEPDEQVWV